MTKETMCSGINHRWTILCGSSSVDQKTNNVSLFNLVEQLSLDLKREDWEKAMSEGKKGFLVQTQFEIVTLWEKENFKEGSPAEAEIRLIDPKGEILHKHPYHLNFPNQAKRHREHTLWSGIKLTQTGFYVFSINIKYPGTDHFHEVGTAELLVNIKIN